MPHSSWLLWKALVACFIGGPVVLLFVFWLYTAWQGKRRY